MTTRVGGATARAANAGRMAAVARFEPGGKVETGVEEASDVVALSGGRFAVVSDTSRKLSIADGRGGSTEVKLDGLHGESQLEGVAYDPVKGRLFVSREETRELYRYAWKGSGEPELEKTIDLDELGGPTNKGVEGLAYLPAGLSPTGEAHLLAVKEGHPRQLLLYRDSGKGDPFEVELDDRVKAALDDFSAVAVDPKTGDVFIASDESAAVAQVRLVRDGNTVRGRFVNAMELGLERIEGLTFDARGDMFVLTENDGVLHRYKRK